MGCTADNANADAASTPLALNLPRAALRRFLFDRHSAAYRFYEAKLREFEGQAGGVLGGCRRPHRRRHHSLRAPRTHAALRPLSRRGCCCCCCCCLALFAFPAGTASSAPRPGAPGPAHQQPPQQHAPAPAGTGLGPSASGGGRGAQLPQQLPRAPRSASEERTAVEEAAAEVARRSVQPLGTGRGTGPDDDRGCLEARPRPGGRGGWVGVGPHGYPVGVGPHG